MLARGILQKVAVDEECRVHETGMSRSLLACGI